MVARRNLMQIVRIPAVLVFELVQPVMFVLLFVYVFAGNIANVPEGIDGYVNYLMPGIIIQNAIFGATTTAIGIAEDLKAASSTGSARSRWHARRCSPVGRPPT